MQIGYMRVSKADGSQTTDLQRDALIEAGVAEKDIYEDHASGKRDDRPGLEAALKALRPGDVLVAWKLDRIGRNLHHLVNTVHDLDKNGIGFKVLTGAPIDTTSPAGKLCFAIFAGLAEFERSLIVERTNAGLASARARGRVGGRKPKMTAAKLRLAQAAMVSRDTNVASLCDELGVTRQNSLSPRWPQGRASPRWRKAAGVEIRRAARSVTGGARYPRRSRMDLRLGCAESYRRCAETQDPGGARRGFLWLGTRTQWWRPRGSSGRRLPSAPPRIFANSGMCVFPCPERASARRKATSPSVSVMTAASQLPGECPINSRISALLGSHHVTSRVRLSIGRRQRTPAPNAALGANHPASAPSICHAGRARRRNTYIALLWGGSMARARLGRLVANILLVAMLAIAAPMAAQAQGAADIDALNKEVAALYGQGKYAEAIPLAKKALELTRAQKGPNHLDTAARTGWLALLYKVQGRYGEAEPLYRRALNANERLVGKEHPYTLTSLSNLAELYRVQGRYAEAEPLYKHALEARERVLGKEHPDTLLSVSNLAALYHDQGRYAEAEPLYRRALKVSERVLGKKHPDTLISVNNLAMLYLAQGRYGEAEPLFRRALDARERVLGKEHPDTLLSVSNLAALYSDQGRYSEAEPLYKRALVAYEQVLGKEHPDTLRSVNNLATLYDSQGRYGEVEPLYKRALAVYERVLGPEHPNTLTSVNNLAGLYLAQGRYSEAEPLLKRAFAVRERVLGKEHPDTLTSVSNLAALYDDRGRYAEAEPLYKRALEAWERVLGKEHPYTLASLNNLAALYDSQSRYAEAEPLFRRALEARERTLGKEHPDTLLSVSNLAGLYFEQSDWTDAARFWRRSTAAVAGRTQRGAVDTGQALPGKKRSEANRLSWQFWSLVKAVYRLEPVGHDPDAVGAREMFQTAQWAAGSDAAKSVAQMAARGAAGDPALAALARERQDLLAEWQKRDDLRNISLGMAPDKRDAKAEAENTARLAAIDARVAEIDKRLAAEFPDYAGLATPAPLDIEDVQAQLRPDEALVLSLDTPELKPTPEETFIWVVTKTEVRWVRSEFGTAALGLAVAAMRCGLDDAAWADENCSTFATLSYTAADRNAGKTLPFDLALAHKVYRALFGQVEDLIKGKQLLIVPSGALAQLPFQTLVTALPADAVSSQAPREVSWLGALAKNLTSAERQALKLPEGHGICILTPFSKSPAEAAGLKQGDILLSFEGEDFGDYPKLVEAIRTHAPDSNVQFRVLRDGTEFTATVTLGRTALHVPRLLGTGEGKDIAWLIRDHALTVLPAVSSLKALRRVARPSAATKPMIGFGNPLLDGDPASAEDRRHAQRARDNQACAAPKEFPVAQTEPHGGIPQVVTRGGLADLSFIRKAPPLPETADELCAVARDVHADAGDIYLGARATEREVKRLSKSGQLAQYRIVHFATHGALAGQMTGNSEPGLILTPPDVASDEDDGYLTASEIAALKLDADWVILSACNTAAGGAQDAQALSGLARAFIYAQAHALLVSHWGVNSGATVKLITGATSRLAADKSMGHAEALRQSMLALIDKGGPYEAHPAFWAPFIVVGEGAATQ